ncbi:AI-2E family transporter [Candidatus Poribacteria bacterium]|nr:AI-2E family transporter [Candidatus Poribacteria bacterium]
MKHTDSPEKESTADQQLTESSILAIICIVLTAAWIAFAFYKGAGAKSADGDSILLLHPIVSILLIVTLACIRPRVQLKSIVNIQMLMIAIWLFSRLLGVLMPFILGFGFAYFFRFLLQAMQEIPLPKGRRLQLSRGWARGLLTAIIFGVFALLFLYVIPQIGMQSREMGKGLVKFFYQSLVPTAIGEEFNTIAVQPDNSGVIYLGKEHGLYRLVLNQGEGKEAENITGDELVGQPIEAIATAISGEYNLYVGTNEGLYGRKRDKDSRIWHQLGNEFFDGKLIKAISIPSWNASQIYVGTNVGLYRGEWESQSSTYAWKDATFLCSTNLNLQSDLNSNTILVNLRRAFENQGIPLSKNLKVAVENPDSRWQITDVGNNKSYTVKKEADKLNVYDSTLPPNCAIYSIACSSGRERKIYAATDHGVYWSVDESNDGNTWSLIDYSNLPEDTSIQTLAVALADGKEQLYAGASKKIYRWDTREGWRANIKDIIQPLESVSLLAALPHQQILYAGNEIALFRRTNSNAEWNVFAKADEGLLVELERLGINEADVEERIKEYLKTKLPTLARTGSDFVGTLIKSFSSIALGFGGFLATAFLTLMVFIYANQSFRNYILNFVNLFPSSNRDTVKSYLREIDKNLQSFLQGQVTVILIVSIISIIVYSIIGVPFSLIVGLLAGLCNAIPTFGPFIGGAFAVLSLLVGFAGGYFDVSGFLIRLVALLGGIMGIQAIDNSLISPKVMSSAVDVDPLLIMFGVIVGASVLGFWGVILAIPIIVVIKSVITVSKEIRTQEVE